MDFKKGLRNVAITGAAVIGLYAVVDYLFVPKEYNITHYLTKSGRLEQKMNERQEISNGEEINRRLSHFFSWAEDSLIFRAGYNSESSDNNYSYSVVYKEKLLGVNRCAQYAFSQDIYCYGFYKQGKKTITTKIFTERSSQTLGIEDKSFGSWYAKKNLSKKNLSNLQVTITQPCKTRYSLNNSLDKSIVSLFEFKWDTIDAQFVILKDKYTTSIRDFHIKDMAMIFSPEFEVVSDINKTLSSETLLDEYFGDFVVRGSIISKEIENDEEAERVIDFKLLKPSRTSSITLPFTSLSEENQDFVRDAYSRFLKSGITQDIQKDNRQMLEVKSALEKEKEKQEQVKLEQ
ncbi:MAG: hypothetical protein ACP5N2_00505 [Candidatus Nanoarchaeia archaeon]